jgi:hypothetical protein
MQLITWDNQLLAWWLARSYAMRVGRYRTAGNPTFLEPVSVSQGRLERARPPPAPRLLGEIRPVEGRWAVRASDLQLSTPPCPATNYSLLSHRYFPVAYLLTTRFPMLFCLIITGLDTQTMRKPLTQG